MSSPSRSPEEALELRTVEAAGLLRVTPNTLRAMDQRFAFPHSRALPGGTRRFPFVEVIALRDALQSEQSITAAVARAKSSLAAPGAAAPLASW